MTNTIDDRSTGSATPVQLGVGMRFSLHPHCDDFIEVILGALQDAADAGLTEHLVLQTDEVSTFVGVREDPAEEHLVSYLSGVISAASRRSGGGHVVVHRCFGVLDPVAAHRQPRSGCDRREIQA